jgi:cell division protein FtsB
MGEAPPDDDRRPVTLATLVRFSSELGKALKPRFAGISDEAAKLRKHISQLEARITDLEEQVTRP